MNTNVMIYTIGYDISLYSIYIINMYIYHSILHIFKNIPYMDPMGTIIEYIIMIYHYYILYYDNGIPL